MPYPNSIAFLSATLLVVATPDGLYRLDTETMDQRLIEAEPGIASRMSLDGLVLYKKHDHLPSAMLRRKNRTTPSFNMFFQKIRRG